VRKPAVWLALLFALLVVAVVVLTSTGVARYRCEVCISYAGRSACRTAGAGTRAEALRTATVNACAQIASGVTESNQCETTQPDRVRWLNER